MTNLSAEGRITGAEDIDQVFVFSDLEEDAGALAARTGTSLR